MFIDASVIVAIVAEEDGWEFLLNRLNNSDSPRYASPVVVFEATLGVARRKHEGDTRLAAAELREARDLVEAFLELMGVSTLPVTASVAAAAIEACAIYGKVVGHPAQLNLGDCFAYACARSADAPLLYKGDDFARTDLA